MSAMRAAGIEPQLHIVRDAMGRTASFGQLQATWLLERGHITGQPSVYSSVELTADEVNELVLAQPELRECDFCRQVPSHWVIRHRPFDLTYGPAPGRLERALFACDVCAQYIERNDKDGLVEYAIASTVEYARSQGGALAAHVEGLPWHRIKQGLTPLVRQVVYGMFGTREGRPVRIADLDGAA